MNSRKNPKLHEKVKLWARTQNNAREPKIMAKMKIYPAFTRNNPRTRRNSLFFSGKIGRAETEKGEKREISKNSEEIFEICYFFFS